MFSLNTILSTHSKHVWYLEHFIFFFFFTKQGIIDNENVPVVEFMCLVLIKLNKTCLCLESETLLCPHFLNTKSSVVKCKDKIKITVGPIFTFCFQFSWIFFCSFKNKNYAGGSFHVHLFHIDRAYIFCELWYWVFAWLYDKWYFSNFNVLFCDIHHWVQGRLKYFAIKTLEELRLKPKLSMFYALSQDYDHWNFEK